MRHLYHFPSQLHIQNLLFQSFVRHTTYIAFYWNLEVMWGKGKQRRQIRRYVVVVQAVRVPLSDLISGDHGLIDLISTPRSIKI